MKKKGKKQLKSSPLIIIGLGNPGSDYHLTPHNAGFLCIDYLCGKLGVEMDYTASLNYAEAAVIVKDREMRLIKPLTYMNLSGKVLPEINDKYGVTLSDIFVVYDDVDIAMGSIRIRKKGGAGTHNGMKSMISYMSCGEFPRIRVGVNSVVAGQFESLADYVLTPAEDEVLAEMMKGVELAGNAVLDLADNSIDIVMNKYNRKIESSASEQKETIPCSF
jgi:PTH1 family peptidyl-tRNA hydrolase